MHFATTWPLQWNSTIFFYPVTIAVIFFQRRLSVCSLPLTLNDSKISKQMNSWAQLRNSDVGVVQDPLLQHQRGTEASAAMQEIYGAANASQHQGLPAFFRHTNYRTGIDHTDSGKRWQSYWNGPRNSWWLPTNSMVMSHSYVNVYQRVDRYGQRTSCPWLPVLDQIEKHQHLLSKQSVPMSWSLGSPAKIGAQDTSTPKIQWYLSIFSWHCLKMGELFETFESIYPINMVSILAII